MTDIEDTHTVPAAPDTLALRPVSPAGRFTDPFLTASGESRARVRQNRLDTLWINTGTLCNIECVGCYIESSPRNDRLVYLTAREVTEYLDEIREKRLGTTVIGFTGGEPFMNPHLPAMLEDVLVRGLEALVLTNAMQPMMRPALKTMLLKLNRTYGRRLLLRTSLDHYTAALHDRKRGKGTFERTLQGLRWLSTHKFHIAVGGRTCWGEEETPTRNGYHALFEKEGIGIDATNPQSLLLFPEMDENADVPEITTACWDILGVDPGTMMCATSRMVVKRKGAARPGVVACTLLPYDTRFELGASLEEAAGEVALNHPHCARFCVLGGGSCSG